MAESRAAGKLYPVFTLLVGLVSYLIGGVLAGLISGEIVVAAVGVPVGSLLMLSVLCRITKKTMIKAVIGSELAGLTGLLAGFIVGESISGILGFFFPALGDLSKIKAQIVPNVFVLIVADAIFGAVISHLLFGKKAIRFFVLSCGILSIPFGILLSMPIDLAWIGFDQNLLFTVISYGTTTGFSIGLYRFLKCGNR